MASLGSRWRHKASPEQAGGERGPHGRKRGGGGGRERVKKRAREGEGLRAVRGAKSSHSLVIICCWLKNFISNMSFNFCPESYVMGTVSFDRPFMIFSTSLAYRRTRYSPFNFSSHIF